jgi:tagatose 1,6-diphosphate aldolase
MEPFARYPDWTGMRQALLEESVAYMRELNVLTAAAARPFDKHPCFGIGGAAIADPTENFRHSYGDI